MFGGVDAFIVVVAVVDDVDVVADAESNSEIMKGMGCVIRWLLLESCDRQIGGLA